jgi:DNA replication protein
MKDQVYKLLTSKKIVINDYLIKIATKNNLSLNEFLVLAYFDNGFSDIFDIDEVSKVLGISQDSSLEAFNGLMVKGMVVLESVKDYSGKYKEIVKLDGLYDSLVDDINKDSKESEKKDIFKEFESELGRTMSSTELEIINGWLVSGTPEDIILGALKEAVSNDVRNFRYIDKIIYEWEKKGFKNMEDVNAYMTNRKESKNKEISKKDQELSEYDWLDG